MKILLIYPTCLDSDQKAIKYKKCFMPPLSLAIIKALTPSHHDVIIINDMVEDVPFDDAFDLVGITVLTSQAERAYQIAKQFRAKGTKVVMGGVHASLMPEEAIQHADSVVIGEAEPLWSGVLEDAEKNNLQPYYQSTEPYSLEHGVSPDWSSLDKSSYWSSSLNKFPRIPIYTTRGCTFGCKFCSVSKFFGRTHRFREISHVVEEINSTPFDRYFIVDDNLTCNTDYAVSLFDAIKKCDISWIGQTSTQLLKTPDIIPLMSKAGCRYLFLGVESLSNANLKSVRKGFNNPEHYAELFARLHEAGIQPWISIIFGFDHDTRESLCDTIKFLLDNHIYHISIWLLTPLPGTDLYDEMNQNGRLTASAWSEYDLTNVVFKPNSKHFTQQELQTFYWEKYFDLYRWPTMMKRFLYAYKTTNGNHKKVLSNIAMQLYHRGQVRSFNHPFSMGIQQLKS